MVFKRWRIVHKEWLKGQYGRVQLIVEDDGSGQFCASLKTSSWSAGTGQWFDLLADAIEDGRALHRKHENDMRKFDQESRRF